MPAPEPRAGGSPVRRGAITGFWLGALAGGLLAHGLLRVNGLGVDAVSFLKLLGLLAAVYGAAGLLAGAIAGPLARAAAGGGRSGGALTARRLPRASVVAGVLAAAFAVTAAAGVAASLLRNPEPPLALDPAPAGLPRVLLIGIDGLDWKITGRLIAAGEMPNLAALGDRGFAAPLKTFRPTLSPLIWNSIASGVKPERHGVEGFAANRISGVDASFVKLVPHAGLGPVLAGLQKAGLARLVPIGSDMCHVPRIWDVAGAAGRRVATVNWWATWPADPVNGWLVTDRFYYFRDLGMGKERVADEFGTVFPADALQEFSLLRVSPGALTHDQIRRFLDLNDDEIDALGRGPYRFQLVDSEFPFLLSMDETYRRIGLRILGDPKPPDLAAFYFRGVDILSHAALCYSELSGDTSGQPEEMRRKYGAAVRRYYAYTDELVGELIEAAGPETTVLLVSDHGFEKQENGVCGHDDAPPGVIFGGGGLIRQGGDAKGATVYDVAPTVLYLAGAPVADDLPGQVLSGIVQPDHWTMLPPREIPTFGRRVERAGGSLGEQDEEYLQRLRALGYIK